MNATPKPTPPPSAPKPPATNTNDILLRLAAIKAVKDSLTGLETEAKAELLGTVRGRMGATTATLDSDEAEAATVTISLGAQPHPYVADQQAFLQWCKANRPHAIVEAVRATDQAAILAAIPDTGEWPDGVAMSQAGSRSVTVRQTAAQRTATVDAWRRGELPLPNLQLEAGK